MTEHTEDTLMVLDAWLDGEHASRGEVLAALQTDQGRQYIVDAMALRRVCQMDAPASSPVIRSRWPLYAAAAAVVVAATGAFAAGRLVATGQPPAPAPTSAEVARPATVAPTPTRVIQFEPGVDWRETVGGD